MAHPPSAAMQVTCLAHYPTPTPHNTACYGVAGAHKALLEEAQQDLLGDKQQEEELDVCVRRRLHINLSTSRQNDLAVLGLQLDEIEDLLNA